MFTMNIIEYFTLNRNTILLRPNVCLLFPIWRSQAIGVILQREQEKIASVQRSAYLLLEATKRRLQEEAEAVQNELRVRELQEERERRKLRATARDTPMNDALSDFEEKVSK